MSPLQVEMIWRGAPVMGRSSPTGKEISRDATRNLFIPHIKYLLTPFRSEITVFLHTTQTRHCFHWLKQECFFHQVLSDVPKGRRKTGLCNLSCYVFMCVTYLWISSGRSHSHFKLKCQARLCEMWTAFCTEEVCEGSTDPERSFVLGWPTTNCVANFR